MLINWMEHNLETLSELYGFWPCELFPVFRDALIYRHLDFPLLQLPEIHSTVIPWLNLNLGPGFSPMVAATQTYEL